MQYAFAFGLQQHELNGEISWKASFELEYCVIWVQVAAVLENGSNPSKQNTVWKNPTFWYICLLAWHAALCSVFFLKIGGGCTVLKFCSFLPSALQRRASFQDSSVASLLRGEELAKCFARSVTSELTFHNSWVVHSPSSQQMLAQNEIIHDQKFHKTYVFWFLWDPGSCCGPWQEIMLVTRNAWSRRHSQEAKQGKQRFNNAIYIS